MKVVIFFFIANKINVMTEFVQNRIILCGPTYFYRSCVSFPEIIV